MVRRPPHQRVLDPDRERVVKELGRNAVAGRLGTDELAERVELALGAPRRFTR